MRLAVLFLAIGGSVLSAQTATATIQGTVTDEQNKGIAGAIVIIHRTFAAKTAVTPYSRTMKTASDGSFVAPELPPGTYTYCAQAGDGILNGCHWNPPSVEVTLTAGQKLRVAIRLSNGSILKVRVVDPQGLAVQSSADKKSIPILMGVWDRHGHFLPVHPTATNGAVHDYQLTIPYDTPLSFQLHSPKVKVSDEGGADLPAAANAAAASQTDFQHGKADPNPKSFQFNVKGVNQ
jgi:hypothetical protein